MKQAIINFWLVVAVLQCLCVGTMQGTTAAKGVFTVAAGKTVQFADANETALVQWATANEWREAKKNEEGHNGWYVLNHDEWTYLMITRDGEGMSKNNLGTVNGKKGLIILPDNWVQPLGIRAFQPITEGTNYDKNIFNEEEWEVMSAAGAVFLPCKGYSEDGTEVINPTDHGAYWSSDQYSDLQGYSIHFNEGEIHDQNTYASKALYYSILLVKEVSPTMLDEDDYLATFTTKLASADDYNFGYMHRTFAKDSTLYTLCLPFDVPNVDASPLAGAEVFEFQGGRVSGATGMEHLYLYLSRLNGKRLEQGVPYLLRWAKTSPVETLSYLWFYDVENWDNNTEAAEDPGNAIIKFHGVYPKAHIPGYTSSEVAHYNFFMGANNTLYWPDDKNYLSSDMKGFRSYFYIIHDEPGAAPRYRNMPAVWQIEEEEVMGYELPMTDDEQNKLRCTKEMRQGVLLIRRGEKTYSILGQSL